MSKMKSLIFLVGFVLLSSPVISQKIFREGYIVKGNGETVKGLVAYSPGKKELSKCIFKRFDIAVEITYSAADLKAFGYRNGGRFESVDKGSRRSFEQTIAEDFSERDLTDQVWRSNSASAKVGVVTGLNSYSLSLSAMKGVFVPSPEPEISPMFGISYERVLSKKSDRLVLRTELLYLRQTFYSYTEQFNTSGKFIKDDAFFDFSALRIPVLFQYTFSKARVKPFFLGGITATALIKKNYFHINEREGYFGDIEINEDRNMKINSTEYAGAAGTGVRIRLLNQIDLRVEGRVEFGTGLFAGKELMKQHSLQPALLIGLTF